MLYQKTYRPIQALAKQKFISLMANVSLIIKREGFMVEKFFYYINTNEIPSELSRENMICLCVKVTCYLHT